MQSLKTLQNYCRGSLKKRNLRINVRHRICRKHVLVPCSGNQCSARRTPACYKVRLTSEFVRLAVGQRPTYVQQLASYKCTLCAANYIKSPRYTTPLMFRMKTTTSCVPGTSCIFHVIKELFLKYILPRSQNRAPLRGRFVLAMGCSLMPGFHDYTRAEFFKYHSLLMSQYMLAVLASRKLRDRHCFWFTFSPGLN
jgi:hypothetical protein